MRYLLELSYDGSNYQGWQIQPNGLTVQEVLNNAISVIVRQSIETIGCGRTDTGVHARQYFAHFDVENELPGNFKRSLNGILPYDIAVHDCQMVSSEFNSRFDAVSRTYEYQIIFEKDPFLNKHAVRWHADLDIDAMNKACVAMIGTRDFSSFSKVNTDVKHFDCNLMSARWYYRENILIFEVTANRFLRNMVRAMVGTLIMIGEGKINQEKFLEILDSGDRRNAGTSVPAHGLYLVSVEY
ncbi:MAG: tRNA pseudouridine(38-40) synthase TruA [Bacteroidia bacterium]|nr:tRNA pseudouridine(38-40) synthase TruA [Bacteroidia bacterium]